MRYTGIVQKGGEYGRKLGFPTANIPFTDTAVRGTYAAYVEIVGVRYFAAVYADARQALLEAHILDFDADVYGSEMTIHLLEKIREDRVFTDEDDARTTIAADVAATRAYFEVGGDTTPLV